MVRYFNLLLISVFLLVSCKKDDNIFPRNQNSVGNYLFQNEDAEKKKETITGSGTHLMGFQFGSTQRGKIHQVGVYSATLGDYEVVILDSATKNVLLKKTVQQTSLENWAFIDVDPLLIDPINKYIIYTKNIPNKEFYVIKQKTYTKLHYPMKISDITIDHAVFASTGTTALTKDTTMIYGFVDFTFRLDR